ncbi:heparan-alpha-glucosaminide N-acetyltransferase [Ramlibacter sp. MAHUQ-53]|uniref:heparan-alpha-glucosaminide N-acetyltransferase n=1 Tax=unclassified Ramlibacter TaxID=2617605 RepID=UPI00362FC666
MAIAETARYSRLDAWRGGAVAWMTAFHLAFDLAWLGFWRQDFYNDPLWTVQRTLIVSLFLACAGVSQAVALAQGQPARRFWRRWAQVAGAALLVTAGSWLVFPRSFIYFGVLHGIAVMLLVLRLTAGWGAWLWLAGALALGAKFAAAWAHGAGLAPAWLDAPAFNWLGLVGRKPVTEDYVPLVPWLAAAWWGLAAGQWALRRRPHWFAGAAPAPLAWLGRWSLTWYLLHQPVLIGALMLAATLRAQ